TGARWPACWRWSADGGCSPTSPSCAARTSGAIRTSTCSPTSSSSCCAASARATPAPASARASTAPSRPPSPASPPASATPARRKAVRGRWLPRIAFSAALLHLELHGERLLVLGLGDQALLLVEHREA